MLLITWVLQEQATGDLRAVLPHADEDEQCPVSSWGLASLLVATLRSRVLGILSEEWLRAWTSQRRRRSQRSRGKRVEPGRPQRKAA